MYEANKNSKERKTRVADRRNKISEIMTFLAKKKKSQKNLKLLSGYLLFFIMYLIQFFLIRKNLQGAFRKL